MKAAIISALVAAVVSASTATAATLIVTSKNIKNGTIQPVDLSPRTKTALRELSLRRVKASESVAPGDFVSPVAWCPQGERVISGGFGTAAKVITSDRADLEGRGWIVLARNDTTIQLTVTSYAYCLPNVVLIPS